MDADKNEIIATLIHISDLHFRDKFVNEATLFQKQLVRRISPWKGTCAHSYQTAMALSTQVNEILKERKEKGIPAGVVFTGDLTSSGKKGEFLTGTTFLRGEYCIGAIGNIGLNLKEDCSEIDINSTPALFYVPGNHDIWGRNQPDEIAAYRDHFPGNFPKRWKFITRGRPIFLFGLDSTQNTKLEHWLARGRVSPEQLKRFEELLNDIRQKDKQARGAIHIVFLHHPLVDVNNGDWNPTMKLDDREIIAKNLCGLVDLVLAGHVHQEFFSSTHDCMLNHAIAGTATQLFSKCNFLLLDIYNEKIHLHVFEYIEKIREFIPSHKEHTFTLSLHNPKVFELTELENTFPELFSGS